MLVFFVEAKLSRNLEVKCNQCDKLTGDLKENRYIHETHQLWSYRVVVDMSSNFGRKLLHISFSSFAKRSMVFPWLKPFSKLWIVICDPFMRCSVVSVPLVAQSQTIVYIILNGFAWFDFILFFPSILPFHALLCHLNSHTKCISHQQKKQPQQQQQHKRNG